jgi:hypothetical protein
VKAVHELEAKREDERQQEENGLNEGNGNVADMHKAVSLEPAETSG